MVSLARTPQLRVMTGNRRVFDDNCVVRRAPDGDQIFGQLMGGSGNETGALAGVGSALAPSVREVRLSECAIPGAAAQSKNPPTLRPAPGVDRGRGPRVEPIPRVVFLVPIVRQPS